MLVKDPGLKAAFDHKLASNPAFAADPQARRQYFFDRSRWHASQDVGACPVLRLEAAERARRQAWHQPATGP